MFQVTSKTKVCTEPFVDYYEASSPGGALDCALEDAHRYGLPMDAEFAVVEVDPQTLKPSPGNLRTSTE